MEIELSSNEEKAQKAPRAVKVLEELLRTGAAFLRA